MSRWEAKSIAVGLAVVVATLSGLLASSDALRAVDAGLVIETVTPGDAAERAGLRVGDVLRAWQRADSGIEQAEPEPFASPFDIPRLELTEAARGPVRLLIERSGAQLSVEMPVVEWGLRARPPLIGSDLERYSSSEGSAGWWDLAEEWAVSGRHGDSAWLFGRIGAHRFEARRTEAGKTAFARALVEAELAGSAGARLELSRRLARALEEAGWLDEASEVLEEAIARHPGAAGNLDGVQSLLEMAEIARKLGELDRARNALARARAILEREAPHSYSMARCLRAESVVAFVAGDFAAGDRALRASRQLLEDIAPESRAMVRVLSNQASLTYRRGDLKEAEATFRKALGLHTHFATEDRLAAGIYANLANLVRRRGDLLGAERFGRRAVAIQRKSAPRSIELALILGTLGEIADARGDLAGAARWLEQALALQEAVAPDSTVVPLILSSLARTALDQGQTVTSERYARRVMDWIEQRSERNLDVANSLKHLAQIDRRRGDLDTARRLVDEVLEVEERLIPGSLAVADSLRLRAELALADGSSEEAEALLRRALDMQRRNGGASLAEAHTLQLLGRVHRLLGQGDEEARLLARATTLLDLQTRPVDSDYESLAELRERDGQVYRDYIRVLIENGKTAKAFHVLERYRARAFVQILGMRDLTFTADLPADLDRERRIANADYDGALRALLVPVGAPDRDREDALRQRLAMARKRREEVSARIRVESPELAALEAPEPLDLSGARRVLRPGTLLLAYVSVGEMTYLFALGPRADEYEVYSLDIDSRRLKAESIRFRAQFTPGTNVGSIAIMARHLGELLLAPAADKIRRAETVAIASDGALHEVPFAALRFPDEDGTVRYLVEARPLVRLDSVTTLAQGLRKRATAEPTRVVALGDPFYPRVAGDVTEASAKGWLGLGYRFEPLPETRREVVEIARLFGGSTQVHLGRDATEERVKGLPRETSILHFAAHAFVNERFPLESGILLTIPTESESTENGVLQAWEIFEQLRIDADLVTLSACDTAGGKRLSGEGVIGLTRAFRYAGASAVAASLWKVGDESTARLMGAFYRNLKNGADKAEALRQAQLELLRDEASGHSHPFSWAAFQIFGDWR